MNSQVQVIAKTASTSNRLQDWLDVSLRFLSSIKFGIGLMIALAVVTILGTFIVQAPMAEPGQIEQLYAPQIRQILEGVGLFDVFHSSWFIALLGLLCLNITFASIDRFPGTWQYLRHPQKELDEKSMDALPLNAIHTHQSSKLQLEEKIRAPLSEPRISNQPVCFGEPDSHLRRERQVLTAGSLHRSRQSSPHLPGRDD